MSRIMGRTKTKCLKSELMSLGLNNQLCLGQKCGKEDAIPTLRDQNSKISADAVLLTSTDKSKAPTATRTMQRLIEKLSEKRQESYTKSIN